MGDPEATAPQTFAGASLDRAALGRRDRVDELLAAPDAIAVAAAVDGVAIDGDSLARRDLAGAGIVEAARAAGPILLGLERGRPLFALDLQAPASPSAARAFAQAELVGLRDAGGRLPQAEGGLAAYVATLLGWHRRHRFCANCGAPTEVAEAGLSRRCPECLAEHFPRTDPVVIMSVEHEDRMLLGRRRGWPPGRYSVLAGFVAAAETPEEAVVREVAEEASVRVRQARYVTSQPWPFPASLMLGFAALADGDEPRVRDGELEHVAWFERAEVLAARQGDGHLALPPPISIARSLIDRWLDG